MKRNVTRLAAFATVAGLIAFVGLRAYTNATFQRALMRDDPEALVSDPALSQRTIVQGRGVFVDHCASCHGDDGRGRAATGAPDLTDPHHLYGGDVLDVEAIVLHGIRAGDTRGFDLASMPSYGTPKPYARYSIAPLRPAEIEDVAEYVLSLDGRSDERAAVERGRVVFNAAQCWDCHGHDAKGDTAIGAPNLTHLISLDGAGTKADITKTIANGLQRRSPAFNHVLKPWEARAVSVYVGSLSRNDVEGRQQPGDNR